MRNLTQQEAIEVFRRYDMTLYRSVCAQRLLESSLLQYAKDLLQSHTPKANCTIVAYDKDNDVYEELVVGMLKSRALDLANHLIKSLDEDEFQRNNGEPFDWIEVYENWNQPGEERVWVSDMQPLEVEYA